jgi:hypothetical protein
MHLHILSNLNKINFAERYESDFTFMDKQIICQSTSSAPETVNVEPPSYFQNIIARSLLVTKVYFLSTASISIEIEITNHVGRQNFHHRLRCYENRAGLSAHRSADS